MRRTEIGKFILLNTHRSGTGLFLGSLRRGSQIQCHTKAFDLTVIFERFVFDRLKSPFYQFRTASVKRRIDYIFRKKQVFNDFLTELYIPADGVQAVGVRLLYEQADKHPEILEWAVKNDVGIIHLIRKNSLKAIVYTEASLERGLLHSTTRAKPATRMRLSPARLKMQLTRLTQQIKQYRTLLKGSRYLEVFYESLVANQEAETRRVLDFLNIEQSVPPTPDLAKINPDSLQDVIENYQEVQQALSGTTFEKFLN